MKPSARLLYCFALVVGALIAQRASANLILDYRFNETGTNAFSSGNDTTPLTMRNSTGLATDLHGGAGSGVSGLIGDIAFNNTASSMGDIGGTANQPDNDAIDSLTSFTLEGWLKTSITGNTPNSGRLFDKNDGNGIAGYFLAWNGGIMTLQVAGVDGVSAANSADVYSVPNQWVFFAATYDGSSAANNVNFYIGTTNQSVSLVGTHTLNAGELTNGFMGLGVGNGGNTRAFAGWLDNMRIYGSTTDASGVLDLAALESLRFNDLFNIPETSAGIAPLVVVALAMIIRGSRTSMRRRRR